VAHPSQGSDSDRVWNLEITLDVANQAAVQASASGPVTRRVSEAQAQCPRLRVGLLLIGDPKAQVASGHQFFT
jgi:hypothetical protein